MAPVVPMLSPSCAANCKLSLAKFLVHFLYPYKISMLNIIHFLYSDT
uniref:Uncharacterized protein n=1 Tax=Rhizophora mucronata TaxID=61149 RepID=A0A2P2MXI1_RHIMU